LFAIDDNQRDDHNSCYGDDHNPDDFFFFLLVFVDVFHFNDESEIVVRVVGCDVDGVGFGDVLDLKSDVFVDFELGDVVAVHVREKERVEASCVEGEGDFVGV